jgi:PAS domain S-box-containing protein
MPYEAYFRGASQGLVVLDDHGLILEANPKASQLFGYTGGELVGQSIELLIPQRLREEYRKRREGYLRVLHTRSMSMSFGVDVVGRRKDGSEFPVEVSLTYAPGTRHGDVIVVAVTDVTERLALEREARRSETLTSLGTVAAGIAHDLNNPLSVILSRSELLMAMSVEALSSETVSEDLDVIHRQAHRASSIVSGFLELSRHGSNLSAVVSLNDVVDKALLLMRDEMRKKGIEVSSRLDRELPAMYGDAVALERVLINLLSNARDAMVDGGVVRIETARMEERPGWLRLTVADNGPGIRPDALEKIFDLLYTSKPGGTGLGLWLSRRIAQEHKGRIQVQSELGEGATFTLTFPAIDDDAKG